MAFRFMTIIEFSKPIGMRQHCRVTVKKDHKAFRSGCDNANSKFPITQAKFSHVANVDAFYTNLFVTFIIFPQMFVLLDTYFAMHHPLLVVHPSDAIPHVVLVFQMRRNVSEESYLQQRRLDVLERLNNFQFHELYR